MFDLDAMKAKIAKLLAKAESTNSDAERDALTGKAEKLMLQLGIEMAEVEAAGEVKAEDVVKVYRAWRGPKTYAQAMASLAHSVARGFGNVSSFQHPVTYTVVLVGHKTDLELLGQLLTSLETQAMDALHRWQRADPTRKVQSISDRTVGSKSFIKGFGGTVGTRLEEARRTQDVTPGAALVLASKQGRVDDWVNRNMAVGQARTSQARYDIFGAMAGQAAGARADIGNKRVEGDHKRLDV